MMTGIAKWDVYVGRVQMTAVDMVLIGCVTMRMIIMGDIIMRRICMCGI